MSSRWVVVCLLLALAIGSRTAGAAPITFYFESGSAHVIAKRSSDLSHVVDTTLDMGGVYVTFDPDEPSLTDFELTTVTSGPISMLQPWGQFDTFVIESASLTPNVAYESIFDHMITPTKYLFLVGPVDVNGVYSAYNSGGPPPDPIYDMAVPFYNPTGLAGIIDTEAMTLELDGITLAAVPGAPFGEPDDLIVLADISWTGTITTPEPGAASLIALGFVVIGAWRRRSRR